MTELLVETPFSARQLLDWIAQAKLLCYVKDDIEKLRSVGIRSVFDFHQGHKSREALREITEAIGVNTPLLQVVYDQTIADDGIKALFQFRQRLNSPDGGTTTSEPPVHTHTPIIQNGPSITSEGVG